MKAPASPHFNPISLTNTFNANQHELPDALRITPTEEWEEPIHGQQSFLGIPFSLGVPDGPNIIHLINEPIHIEIEEQLATYILFLHAVEDRVTNYQDGFADSAADGNELGQLVSEYQLEYADGTSASVPIQRRFAIQQAHIGWGASAFAAVPAKAPWTCTTASEDQILGRIPDGTYGRGETRHASGRDSAREHMWIYALPNPYPERPLQRIVCVPRDEQSIIYAISTTQLQEHPLRPGVRRKLRLTLPEGVALNAIHELEGLDIDLGTIISARAELAYDRTRWAGDEVDVQPTRSDRSVIVEYAAHSQAKLYVPTGDGEVASYDLSDAPSDTPSVLEDARSTGRTADAIAEVAAAHRPVKLRIVSKETGQPVAVRLHLHGEAGEYLPPRGFHRKVNQYWFEDNYGEFVNAENQYCYIHGECVADLPLGTVYVEATKGYEVTPLRTSFEVTAETEVITLEVARALHWRERGWVTADTHVHFLSPQTALLEGAAEGVNVVNLLASQWGEMFSNVSDFDGKSTLATRDFGAKDLGGDGEFLVRVGTENRMQVLGHISLLGYSGEMITPLCTGGPSESAIGDPQEVTMAEWAQRCIAQGGLTVMPHAPNPQCERAADLVLGLVNAVEMMTFNPHDGQISPYGLADWYRYLNLGYQVPVVGGSDKMAAASLLGGIRTYAQMGPREFTYENWMEAVRTGNTFVTVGPLVALTVNGAAPGSQIRLPVGGGTVDVVWTVESVRVPIEQVEIIVGGMTHEQITLDSVLSASGTASVTVAESTWIAVRVRGSYRNQPEEIAAHTSAIQLLVVDNPIYSQPDAILVLEQIEGAIAYVDTLAPRPDVVRFKQLRATLESAYNRLHQQMHRNGHFHNHSPLHGHDHPHEH